jgi:cell division protein FtsW (lipid II flippase)
MTALVMMVTIMTMTVIIIITIIIIITTVIVIIIYHDHDHQFIHQYYDEQYLIRMRRRKALWPPQQWPALAESYLNNVVRHS